MENKKNEVRRSKSSASASGGNGEEELDPIFLLVKHKDCGRVIGSGGKGLRSLANDLRDNVLKEPNGYVDVICQPFEERDRITEERYVRILGIPENLHAEAIREVLALVPDCRDQHGNVLSLSDDQRDKLGKPKPDFSQTPEAGLDVISFYVGNKDCGRIISLGMKNLCRDLERELDDRRVCPSKMHIVIQPYETARKRNQSRLLKVIGVPTDLTKQVRKFFEPLVEYMEDVDEHVLKDSKNGVGRGDSVRSPPPKPFLEMKVPQRKVGLLLGTKGQTIRRLQDDARVSMTLSQKTKDDGYSILTIEGGEKKCLEEAKDLVEELLCVETNPYNRREPYPYIDKKTKEKSAEECELLESKRKSELDSGPPPMLPVPAPPPFRSEPDMSMMLLQAGMMRGMMPVPMMPAMMPVMMPTMGGLHGKMCYPPQFERGPMSQLVPYTSPPASIRPGVAPLMMAPSPIPQTVGDGPTVESQDAVEEDSSSPNMVNYDDL